MEKTNSIKDLYINIQNLYNNAVNMLTAINQSLQTSSSEVTVTLSDSDDVLQTLRIPSFLYLENKVEQLQNKFENIFNLPKSGEAWFKEADNMYQLQMVRPMTAPVTPVSAKKDDDTQDWVVEYKENTLLKDLVSPKVYLKFNIENLPANIEKMFMKKIVFSSKSMFSWFNDRENLKSYSDIKSALFNYVLGKDYYEYDSVLNVPIKENTYVSDYKILEIVDSWYDYEVSPNRRYDILVDNINYWNEEDPSIVYNIAKGDKLWLSDDFARYEVIDIDESKNLLTIEEIQGHINLQPHSKNNSMHLYREEEDFDRYKYIEVPIEEDEYICIFLGTIYNGVRSVLSDASFFDLSTIYVKGTGKLYPEFYKQYCKNIGDLIEGITRFAFPQLTNYTSSQINQLSESEGIKDLVNQTVDINKLQVVLINSHLIKDSINTEIKNLNSQKAQVSENLSNLQKNIDEISNSLISTDFTQTSTLSYDTLVHDLNTYQAKRATTIEEYKSIVDSISIKINSLKSVENSKFRIRGLFSPKNFIDYLHNTFSNMTDLLAIDVEYYYKTNDNKTNNTIATELSLFTNWNKFRSIERNRIYKEDGSFDFEDNEKNYDISNVIKWHQLDIPIQQGEDVVFRIRYKYTIGQPFFNLYSPWSDEFTIVFPAEYENNEQEMSKIIAANENDKLDATFNETLVKQGYFEHITNKTSNNGKVFFHQAENINSGYYDGQNQMMSIKEKLFEFDTNIGKISQLFEEFQGGKLEVYLTYDGNSIRLLDDVVNRVNVYNTDHIVDSFVRKDMEISFKNVGTTPIKLYSIFPGNTDIPLIRTNMEFYNDHIGNYERYPLFINDNLEAQTMGQWIYFRTNNAYTGESLIYERPKQKSNDIYYVEHYKEDASFKKLFWSGNTVKDYMMIPNQSPALGYRLRGEKLVEYVQNGTNMYWKTLVKKNDDTYKLLVAEDGGGLKYLESELDMYSEIPTDFYKYDWPSISYILRFEDIWGIDNSQEGITKKVFLDKNTKISDFLGNYEMPIVQSSNVYQGAFVFTDFKSQGDILTDDDNHKYKLLSPGSVLKIPIVFEYYLEDEEKVEKSLYYDIRTNIYENPKNFMINFIGYNDFTSTGVAINSSNVQFQDNVPSI